MVYEELTEAEVEQFVVTGMVRVRAAFSREAAARGVALTVGESVIYTC
jgi:hypothetical protein